GGARLVQLQRVDHEVLAQHGEVDGRADADQELQLAAEEVAVGEHRERRRAALLVRPGDVGRVRAGADLAGGRGAALDLGEEAHLGGAAERGREAPGRRRAGRAPTKLRGPAPEGADLGVFDSDDPVENVVLRSTHHVFLALRFAFGYIRFGACSEKTHRSERRRAMALTKKQRQILDYVEGFVDSNGYSPSYEEIAQAFDYSSLAT